VKFNAISIGLTKINYDLDLRHMLGRFYDIDKLKLMLMDREDQMVVFNFLAKPTI
jgi:hypothetical protein